MFPSVKWNFSHALHVVASCCWFCPCQSDIVVVRGDPTANKEREREPYLKKLEQTPLVSLASSVFARNSFIVWLTDCM